MKKDTGESMSIHQMPMSIVIFILLLKLFLLLFLVNPKSKKLRKRMQTFTGA
jgi:hypothetical protein